jgi:hypothetical protein
MNRMSMNLVDLSFGLSRLLTGLWPLQERFLTPEGLRFGICYVAYGFDSIHM